ncbi:MAG TPA: glycosyltransferase [Candidatus Acidoferrales bacterium]|nr:glycosyltransferase [Candidatus Acidoferrales bacterium]
MADGMSGPGDRRRRICFVFFDAGGGHRNAVTALQVQIERQGLPLDVSLVNLQEVLDSLDILRKVTGLRIQDLYNKMLRHGWTLGSPQLMRFLQLVVRMEHGAAVRALQELWKKESPDMVVSVVPHFNRALRESFDKAFPGRPFVTVLTDLADYPKHFWVERESQYVVCGTDKAVEQARALGHLDGTVFRTSGMILHPRFYEPDPLDRAAERKKLGLDPELPTGIVLFGGFGNAKMLDILRQINRSPLQVQLIMICGRNDKLAKALREEPSRIPIHVEGFTTQVPYFMALSDFFIGKPGPGSISEALAKHLPVIIDCNAWTLPQERYNAQWVREKEVGLVVRSHRQDAGAVAELLKPGELEQYRARTTAMENRAIFEIPVIFEKILNETPRTA